jgi:hypothetical protein
MGNYERYTPQKDQGPKVHPVWRGIGCLMMILIPVMAYAAADLFMQAAPGLGWFPHTSGIYGDLNLKYITLPVSMGTIIFTLFFTIFGFLLLSFAYAVIYRFTGPPRYGPTDSPPIRKKKKKRR